MSKDEPRKLKPGEYVGKDGDTLHRWTMNLVWRHVQAQAWPLARSAGGADAEL